MSNFNDILKRGKRVVNNNLSKDERLKKYLATVLFFLQSTNELYDDKYDHNILVSCVNCYKCNKASFIVTVSDLDGGSEIISYTQGLWKEKGQGDFYCPDCV